MRSNRNRKPRNSNNSSNPNPNNKGATGHTSNANPNSKGTNNGHASGGNDGHKKSIQRHKDGVQYLSYSDKQSKNFYYWLSEMSNQSVCDKLTYP